MAKKKKRRIQVPSLSPLDKGLYYALIAIFFVAGLFLFPAIIGSYRRSVFQNQSILAINSHGIFPVVTLGAILGCGSALLMYWLLRRKQPIFGKANITYGPPQWKPVYPIFSKQFWHIAISNKKWLIAVCSATLLIVLIVPVLTSLCLPPRQCLLDDGSIEIYNSLNENTATYNASDVESLRIYTRVFSHKGADDYGIEMDLTMRDGERFWFSYHDFRAGSNDTRGSIAGMHHIKSCFDPSIVVLEEQVDIQTVIDSMDLNQQEIELLYELFDITK